MTDTRLQLLGLLADGAFHSGGLLGKALGRSRAAIWKQVAVLRSMGLEVKSVRGQGYRLPAPFELLSAKAVRDRLDTDSRDAVRHLDLRFTVDSTSSRLMADPAPGPGEVRACIAEYQAGGRGRRGRQWLSPLGSGICLSVSWCYESPPRDLAALGLAVGVAALDAVELVGARGASLKWPNDIVAADGKLAGILVDVAGESGGPLKVVVGIGTNIRLAPGLRARLAETPGAMPAAALADLVPGGQVSRNHLVAELINALRRVLAAYPQDGFAPYADRWRRHDYLSGRDIIVTGSKQPTAGVARGIGPDGALLVESDGVIGAVYAGDVTVRGVA